MLKVGQQYKEKALPSYVRFTIMKIDSLTVTIRRDDMGRCKYEYYDLARAMEFIPQMYELIGSITVRRTQALKRVTNLRR